MSLEKTAPEPIREMLQPFTQEGLRFACHPGVPCFTECCRDLKLLLTPYDILRLKNRLGLQAGAFLEQYTKTDFDERRNLPMIYLNMLDSDRKPCPFVSTEGCLVYEDRPAACRIYPLARATRSHRLHGNVQEDYFILRENHCRGFEEGRVWSTEEWTADQGLEPYHDFSDLWMQIITHPRLRQGTALTRQQQQMFFLASYNMEQFRRFVFESRFTQMFEMPDEEQKAVQESDEALLKLACKWLRFSLLNEPTLQVKQPNPFAAKTSN